MNHQDKDWRTADDWITDGKGNYQHKKCYRIYSFQPEDWICACEKVDKDV